ncbi:hypothetical protein [Rufibacter hautae]|uniref:Uncharacterized protein n=1 Tax=Rufibacter hautae TaxID=2595005 RepID=A0A5B6TNH9_9BACT|nr:hypothetical protein [Rufibacter hautae]KAA3437923.1 hypothetical protein FOA19_11610 [Rufibacter hautae]
MEIVPGKRIGEFKLGDRLTDSPLYSSLKKLDSNKYELENLKIRVNDSGIIDLVSTYAGEYNGITISKTFRQVIEEGNTLLYDDFDQIFYFKCPEGLSIEKEYENLPFKTLLDSKIQVLSVYDIEQDKYVWDKIKEDFLEVSKNKLPELER